MPDNTPPTTRATNTKPGFQTSEFWLSLAAVFVSAILASGLITNDKMIAIFGIISTVLAALGYTVARTALKSASTRQAG